MVSTIIWCKGRFSGGTRLAVQRPGVALRRPVEPIYRISVAFVAAIVAAPFLPASAWSGMGLVCGLAALFRSVRYVAVGACLGWLTIASLPPGPELYGPVFIQGTVLGASSGRMADMNVARWSRPGGAWTPDSGRIKLRFSDAPPPPGSALVALGAAQAYAPSVLPGAPDPVRNAARVKIRTEVVVERWSFLKAQRASDDPFATSRHRGVLRAMVFGDRTEVADDWNALFRNTGTTHILSISGFHVGLVAWVVARAIQLLLRPVVLFRRIGLPDGVAWIVGAAAGVGYAWIAGAPTSAQRAAWMLVLAAVAKALGRAPRPLALLGLAAMAVLVVDPAALGTASFQLSFGAILGLVRVTPWCLKWLPPDLPRPISWFAEALATTVGATVGTLPASAWWFQQYAPTSPIANLLAIPWTSFAVIPASVLVTAAPEFCRSAMVALADGSVDVFRWILVHTEGGLWTPAIGPVGMLAATLLLVWPHRTTVMLSGMMALFSVRSDLPPDATRVTFLDIGQGDAALVEEPDGRRWLIDGGPPGDAVLFWLRRRGIRHVDRVIASHGHPDHTGGLLPVLRDLAVDELWITTGEGNQDIAAVALSRGLPMIVPEARRHPPADFKGSTNDRSLVLDAIGGRWRALFPGDVEAPAEQLLASTVGSVDLLKVPHHGSRTSSTETFLDAVQPRWAVISCGRGNRFGHPHQEVTERYQRRGVAVFRTDELGTIAFTLSEVPSVSAFRGGAGWRAPDPDPALPRNEKNPGGRIPPRRLRSQVRPGRRCRAGCPEHRLRCSQRRVAQRCRRSPSPSNDAYSCRSVSVITTSSLSVQTRDSSRAQVMVLASNPASSLATSSRVYAPLPVLVPVMACDSSEIVSSAPSATIFPWMFNEPLRSSPMTISPVTSTV